jgi:hypothetical protein
MGEENTHVGIWFVRCKNLFVRNSSKLVHRPENINVSTTMMENNYSDVVFAMPMPISFVYGWLMSLRKVDCSDRLLVNYPHNHCRVIYQKKCS